MIDVDDYKLHISKWLNKFINENKIDVEEMSKKMGYSTGYLNVLLDYSKHLDKYEEKDINISIEFIVKLTTTYNVKIEEILLCDA